MNDYFNIKVSTTRNGGLWIDFYNLTHLTTYALTPRYIMRLRGKRTNKDKPFHITSQEILRK